VPHTRRDDQTVEAFSASKDLIAKAKAKAAARGMNKSGYFRYCLAKDLGYSEQESLEFAQHSSVTQLKAEVRGSATPNSKGSEKADKYALRLARKIVSKKP